MVVLPVLLPAAVAPVPAVLIEVLTAAEVADAGVSGAPSHGLSSDVSPDATVVALAAAEALARAKSSAWSPLDWRH